MTTDEIWLTPEAHAKLQQEYAHLTGRGREDVTARIAFAREEGDLSENAGYHAAREEQGQQELRIRGSGDHYSFASNARNVFWATPKAFAVALKTSSMPEILGLDGSIDLAVYSPQSPLGAAIIDKSVGDDVSYEAPNGKQIKVKIVEAKVF